MCGRKLIIDTHNHSAFKLHFNEIIIINDEDIIYEDNYYNIPIDIKDDNINCIDIEREKLGDGGNQCREGYSLFNKNITKNLYERIYEENNFVFYAGSQGITESNNRLFTGEYDLCK